MRSLLSTLSLVAMAGALLAGPSADAADGDPARGLSRPITGVVELFTSQGCSSCPPADALMQSYAERRDVMALSFPVDYWDYLGWRDTLALPHNTERQRAYARHRGDGAVYTPQMVINGVSHAVGSSRREIDDALGASQNAFAARQIPVRIGLDGGAFIIETGPAAGPEAGTATPAATGATPVKEATIWFAVLQRTAEVPVRRGENAGKILTYFNVVREFTPVGTWSGKAQTIRLMRRSIIRPETEACAVIIQDGDGGPIIGAAWMGL